jgi:hypothetical protein
LSAAIHAMARGDVPSDPRMYDLGAARMINQMHGAPVVTMWDVAELPEDEIDFFFGMARDLPRERETQEKVKKLFAEFEARHPTYRKH